MALTAAQQRALGIVGGVEFGMERRALLKAAKELAALSLVVTDGAHCGHNRGTYHWELTEAGMALLIDLVKSGAYPCAGHTAAGRAIQAQVQS